MKFNSLIIILIVFSAFIANSQERLVDEYRFKYVYHILTDDYTNENAVIPAGTDAVIKYDSFYKNYKILYWDKDDEIASGEYFLVKHEGELDYFKAKDGSTLYIMNKVKSHGKLFITYEKIVNGQIMTILFTNTLED